MAGGHKTGWPVVYIVGRRQRMNAEDDESAEKKSESSEEREVE